MLFSWKNDPFSILKQFGFARKRIDFGWKN